MYVGVDDMRSGKIASEYLARKGRKRFAVLAGTRRSPISASFLSGVGAGLAGSSIKIRDGFSAYSEYDAQVAEAIAKKWFAEKAFPDAILVIDDQMIPAIYHAARQRGLAIGQDVSIISRGSAGFAESLEPKLSTIEISGREIGDKAGQILLQSLSKDASTRQKIILSSSLILNGSA